MAKFTSKYVSNRWQKARTLKQEYKKETGKDLSVRDFYKNDNPITSNYVKLEITFSLNYQGEDYNFLIPQEVVEVISKDDPYYKLQAQEMTKTAVSDIFKGRSKDWVYNNLNVEVRGIESSKPLFNELDLNRVGQSGSYVLNNPIVDIAKRKHKGASNKNSYNLNIWR